MSLIERGYLKKKYHRTMQWLKIQGFLHRALRATSGHFTNPEFLATSTCRDRYPLEKRGMASIKGSGRKDSPCQHF